MPGRAARDQIPYPLGPFHESLTATSFGPHPYGHPVLGWTQDLERIGRADVRRFFETRYGPSNATCVLVGDVGADAAFALAEKYLGGIPARPAPPEPPVVEPTSAGEKRLLAEADAEPRVVMLFRTPPPSSKDHDALDVIAGLLGGPSGRLSRALTVEKDLAVSVEAEDDVRRYAGRFRIAAKARADADLEDLEAGLRFAVAKLAAELVPADELARAKERALAEHLKDVELVEGLAERIGHGAVTTGWRHALEQGARASRVGAEEVKRVAAETFVSTKLTVGVLRRPAGEEDGGGKKENEEKKEKRKGRRLR